MWLWSLFPYPSARHQFTLPDHAYGASASRGVPVYASWYSSRLPTRRDGCPEQNTDKMPTGS